MESRSLAQATLSVLLCLFTGVAQIESDAFRGVFMRAARYFKPIKKPVFAAAVPGFRLSQAIRALTL